MPIRVLIVDDSAFMRMLITKAFDEAQDIEVVGTARNGLDAIKRVKAQNPDVVTMDIEMPVLNGIAALKMIMKECPRPVIMLSSLTTRGAEETIEALGSGAFDFLTKPSGHTEDMAALSQQLITKVRLAAASSRRHVPGDVHYTRPSGLQMSSKSAKTPPVAYATVADKIVSQLVAIGTSTGGPRALDVVLRALPATTPCPILVVQHMPPKFTQSLASRLDGECAIQVVEAKADEVLRNGVAYIAPGGWHMTVVRRDGRYRIGLNEAPKRNEHRPSVDVLFESLAEIRNISRYAVLMTGMGNDGAAGMARLKESGATTIAESERTCVVYGMPRAAVELGCVDEVVPLEEIGPRLVHLIHPGLC